LSLRVSSVATPTAPAAAAVSRVHKKPLGGLTIYIIISCSNNNNNKKTVSTPLNNAGKWMSVEVRLEKQWHAGKTECREYHKSLANDSLCETTSDALVKLIYATQ